MCGLLFTQQQQQQQKVNCATNQQRRRNFIQSTSFSISCPIDFMTIQRAFTWPLVKLHRALTYWNLFDGFSSPRAQIECHTFGLLCWWFISHIWKKNISHIWIFASTNMLSKSCDRQYWGIRQPGTQRRHTNANMSKKNTFFSMRTFSRTYARNLLTGIQDV